MNPLRYPWLTLFLLVAIAFAGCAGPAPVPADHFYRLPEAAATPLDRPPLKGTLSVMPFGGGGLYNERSILYVDLGQPLELKRYRYYLWNNAPGYLLQEHLFSFLRNAGAAEQVVIHQPGSACDYKLSGSIRHFERELGSGLDRVNVTLNFSLLTGNTLLWEKEYQLSVTVAGGGVHDAVAAFGTALTQIYTELLQDIRRTGS